MEQPCSNLFEGYKSVGNVTGPKPFIVRHGKKPEDTRIVTIVGRTFHTYTTSLALVEVSIPHEKDINMIIADESYIYSTSGRSVLIWARGSKKLIQRLDNGHQADIVFITKFGRNRILSVDEDNVVINWDISEKEILNILQFPDTFKITAICHPMHYKDKVLLGSECGKLQLWNVVAENCVYKFEGWGAKVTCLVQSPIQDVLGIGLESGYVYLHNILLDESVRQIYQEYGAVTTMSFRLDDQPYLVTGSEIGHLMVWNLELGRLAAQMRNIHADSISKCQFLRNEALLVTSGSDNTIKIWSMHLSDGSGALLCQRAGHSKPPSHIRFYGPKGFNLLSAGNDSTMKMFHMFSERLNRNLGTARWNHGSEKRRKGKILPPITCFSAESAKESQWDNIAACHKGSSLVTTWNYDKCKLGKHLIHQPTFKSHGVFASSICVSACGNFVVIGFSNGFVFKYNMQSGIFRQTYECPEDDDHRAHDGSVTGVAIDSLDIVLVSCGSDCKLRVWNFKTATPLLCQDFDLPIRKFTLHKDSNLLAIAMEDRIEVMDLETRTMIRTFKLTAEPIDMALSPDSRWLIVCLSNKCIATWDLSLGKMIDAFRTSSQCTSLALSATGEFLATAHEETLGINVWCNFTIYNPSPLRAIDESAEPPLLDMPFVRCDEVGDDDKESDDQTMPQVGEVLEPIYVSPGQLDENLITMSSLPTSRWKNLLNIDDLRKRQLIEEQEKRTKPVKVPFFIPIKEGLKPQLDKDAVEQMKQKALEDRLAAASKIQSLNIESPLIKCLLECGTMKNYDKFFADLKELGPSATDAEIRSLGYDTSGSNQAMLSFLDAIEYELNKNIDFELVSSWLALFLKAHSDLIQADLEVAQRCKQILDPFKSSWSRLSAEFNQVFCVLNFVRSSIL